MTLSDWSKSSGRLTPVRSMAWRRVNGRARCPVCGHDSWCTVRPDAGAVRCKRVESTRPCPGADGDAWLHVLDGQPPQPAWRPLPVLKPPPCGLDKLAREFRDNATAAWIEQTADYLSVAPEALVALGVGRDRHGNLAVPMVNAMRTIVGIRIRTPGGRKFAVTGGREGLFLGVDGDHRGGPLLFPEGPTSSAAALTLGFEVVGRPSCSGGVGYCTQLARGRDCVVVADADPPGRRGAERLAGALLVVARSVRVLIPPAEDLRAWLRAGAQHADVETLIASSPVRLLTVRYRS